MYHYKRLIMIHIKGENILTIVLIRVAKCTLNVLVVVVVDLVIQVTD